jgi:23S rRNA (adenine2503-C2)-methyltransferase
VIELHDSRGLAAHCSTHKVDPQVGRRVVRAVLQRGLALKQALAELRQPVPDAWAEGLVESSLECLERRDSESDGATKWLFRASNGETLESVLLRIASGRRSLCVSIQSHCPIGCTFCSSGFTGKPKSLLLKDVLGQVLFARQHLEREGSDLRNLVFMGMGEPLLEEPLLHRVLEHLTDDRGFAFSPSRITVSTVGLPDAMLRLSEAFPKVHQALSLHSAEEGVRERLIPIAKRHSLESLRQTVLDIGERTGAAVLVEYLLLAGVNDSAQAESALAAWLEGLRVKLNLIPYNPPPHNSELGTVDMSLRGTAREDRESFAQRMRERGVPTTLRYSLGSEIAAACGQLAVRPT